jgi:murein L,D-transpeptidase YcbB/YkuD
MAAAVLGSTVEHVKERLAEGHNSEDVPGQIPVYVAYFTAWPDANGRVGYYADIYGRDAKLMKALQSTEAVRGPTS